MSSGIKLILKQTVGFNNTFKGLSATLKSVWGTKVL